MESTIREQNAAKFNGHRSESERLKTELQHTSEKIGSILQNQARMNLNEDALSIMAEELNRLAQKKQALEKQLRLTEEANIAPESAKFQALFVHNQIRACLQGWAKASPSVQKRLLRRTIKEIVVTHDEMLITFWMSNEEQAASYGTQPVLDGNEKILPIRGRLRSNRDRNDRIAGSGDVRNGSEGQT